MARRGERRAKSVEFSWGMIACNDIVYLCACCYICLERERDMYTVLALFFLASVPRVSRYYYLVEDFISSTDIRYCIIAVYFVACNLKI